MQPDNSQYSIDYLNSISATPPQKTISPVVLWALIGGVLLLVIFVVIFVMSLGGGSKDNLQTFAAKISSLETVTKDAQENIQSSDLRTLNSSLTLVLTNANRDIAAQAGKADPKSTASKKIAAETTVLNNNLEDARLNGVYDRTYAREIAYYLKKLRAEMATLYGNTKSKSLKTYLEKTDGDIKPLADSIAAFNAG